MPNHRRQRGDGVQAIVFTVDRPVSYVDGQRRKSGARRSAETQLLTLEIAEMLIHGQSGDRGNIYLNLTAWRCCAGQFIGLTAGMCR